MAFLHLKIEAVDKPTADRFARRGQAAILRVRKRPTLLCGSTHSSIIARRTQEAANALRDWLLRRQSSHSLSQLELALLCQVAEDHVKVGLVVKAHPEGGFEDAHSS